MEVEQNSPGQGTELIKVEVNRRYLDNFVCRDDRHYLVDSVQYEWETQVKEDCMLEEGRSNREWGRHCVDEDFVGEFRRGKERKWKRRRWVQWAEGTKEENSMNSLN